MFPEAQFCVTGVLGPSSNAHGPNEFLHIPFSTKLTCCIASVLASHCASRVEASLQHATEGGGAGGGDGSGGAAPKKPRQGAADVDVSDLVVPATERNER